jgi:hypothetical protein
VVVTAVVEEADLAVVVVVADEDDEAVGEHLQREFRCVSIFCDS